MCLVQHVEDAGGRPPSDSIMHEIGIKEGGGMDHFALCRGHAWRDLLFGSAIYCVHPFILFGMLSMYGLVVRDASPEADGPMGMLHEVTDQGGQHEVQHGIGTES